MAGGVGSGMVQRVRGRLPAVLVAAGGVLVLTALFCVSGEKTDGKTLQAGVADQTKRIPVKTLTMRAQEREVVRTFPGKVRASKRVNLSFELDGVLVDLPISEGALVKKGELLAKLDPRDYENNLRSAKAKYTEAKQNFERAQRLLKEKVIPQATFETAQSTFDSSQAQVKICEKALEDTELHAPFDGTVAKRLVQNHQRVAKHEDILSLQNASSIEIVIQVPESSMAKAGKRPLPGSLEAEFDAIAGRKFPVEVHEFRVDADTETQTYEVVLAMPAPKEYNILPGMTATILLRDDNAKATGVWWLPAAALTGSAQTQETFVYCLDPNYREGSRLVKKAVKIGPPAARGIPVLEGLQDGDEVVVAGSRYVHEGMLVRPLEAQH